MAIITQKEYNNIKVLTESYCTDINKDFITFNSKKYAHLDVKQKYDLIITLHRNIMFDQYESDKDVFNAKKIITDMLSSITEKDLENCIVINDDNIDVLKQTPNM